MSKKTMKILSCLAIILCIVLSIVPVFAAINPGSLKGTDDSNSSISDIGNDIIGIVKNIAIVISVVVIIVLGIKYMMGSAEEKAEYKKTMLPYFIGAVFVFASANIVTVIQSVAEKI